MPVEIWYDICLGFVVLCVVFFVFSVGVAVFGDHKVVDYYILNVPNVSTTTTCIVQQREWASDITGPCFSNPNDTLAALQQLKKK